MNDTTTKIYVTSEPLPGLPLLLFLFVKDQCSVLEWSGPFATLLAKKVRAITQEQSNSHTAPITQEQSHNSHTRTVTQEQSHNNSHTRPITQEQSHKNSHIRTFVDICIVFIILLNQTPSPMAIQCLSTSHESQVLCICYVDRICSAGAVDCHLTCFRIPYHHHVMFLMLMYVCMYMCRDLTGSSSLDLLRSWMVPQ